MFRKIYSINDKKQIIENERISFGKSRENNLDYQKYIDTNNTFGIFNLQGDLKSSLSIYPRNIISNNINLRVLGIGHVATRPEFRNQGNMKKILEQVLVYGWNNNYDVSILYPYSCALYQSTGFRICEYCHRIELDLEQLKQIEPQGRMEKCDSRQVDSVNKIYKKYIKFLNRGEIKKNVLYEEKNEREVRFFWRNKKKIRKSFIEFVLDNEKNIKINKFYYFDNEGLYGMLGAMRVFAGRYKRLIWDIPDGININACISKLENVEIVTKVKTMIRIINLEKLLLKIPYNYKKDMYLEVIDPIIKENTGIYRLSKNGNKKIDKKSSAIQAISMNIEELTSILFEENKGVNYRKNETRWNKLQLQIHIEQYF